MDTSIEERIIKFSSDRDWDQFHSPSNLAKSIVIEAAELLENFQWDDQRFDLQNVSEELADVMIYCCQLANKLDLNIEKIMNDKLDLNEEKYPIQKARGSSRKYTEFKE
ncbi:MAG: nucleotide pyrophosphohydrolase [Clostridiaceae bacterium]|jgi:NTP pyrophosphatase (non-canonical NTP hydrolase)|nr:nucleotide pyrophosphohydrolase [Clostridiaceae bacterium]